MFFVNLFTTLSQFMEQSFWFAATGAFIWGILSILLSPCHLSSIPLVIGVIVGQQDRSIGRAFKLSLVFSLGILVSVAIIGGITASLGRLMGDVGRTGNILIAILFIIVGLYLMDIIPLNWSFIPHLNKSGGYRAALLLGLLFGVALGPCTFAFIAPVLGIIFKTAQTSYAGALLLVAAFAAGHCGVIVLAGTLTGKVQSWLNWTQRNKSVLVLKRICGALVALAGVYYLLT
jgi:cytochrome c-type biogenesis protein